MISSELILSKEITFESLYEYKNDLYRFIYKIIRNHSDAEEVLQDTFIRALRGLANFKRQCSIKSWLYTIARNACYNRRVFNKRHKINELTSLDEKIESDDDNNRTLSDVIPDNNLNIISDIEVEEYYDQIKANQLLLNKDDQIILNLKVNENLSYEEIATKLGIKIGTAKSRLNRARQHLISLTKI